MHLMTKPTSVGLITAPDGFWELSPDELREVSNGAGPKGFGLLVPDTLWGLDITLAADVHDYMYQKDSGKELADWIFYQNMLSIIRKEGGWLEWFRERRAKKYYLAVKVFGTG